MPFSQQCRTLSIGGRICLAQFLNKIMRLSTYSKKVAPNVRPTTKGAVFTNMPNCFSELTFYGPKSENKFETFFWKISLTSNFHSTHVECKFDKADKKIVKNSKAFHLNSKNNYTDNQFSRKKTFQEKTSPVI